MSLQHELNKNWCVIDNDFDESELVHRGTKFMTANGYMGYRGTLSHHKKAHLVGNTLAGIYDQFSDKWREPVNAPNSLFAEIWHREKKLTDDANIIKHQQSLDIYHSKFISETTFQLDGITLTVKKERFLSASNIHLIAERTILTSNQNVELTLITGIDDQIWEQNGPHFHRVSVENRNNLTAFIGETNEGDTVAVSKLNQGLPCNEGTEQGFSHFNLLVSDSDEFCYNTFASVYTSKDVSDPVEQSLSALSSSIDYEQEYKAHSDIWAQRWGRYDVVIDGDERGQLALRYSIYQLLAVAPTHSDTLAIPARGLSAQVYKGAMFWDTEMHMLPMFNLTDVDIAKNLLRFRTIGLDSAKKKAEQFGYSGAFYPWEAQEYGQEMCSFFNITNVFTGRKIRTYFVDRQIHVNSAIIYSFWEHYCLTKDLDFLLNEGAGIFIESLRFFYSYAYFKHDKDRFELLGVVGPDEYHECVHNNFYTNRLVQDSLEKTFRLIELAKENGRFDEICSACDLSDTELNNFRVFAEKLYVPEPNEQGVIEQHDGYFNLEDITLDEIKNRVLDKNEHWGGAWGIASDTQIIKQADTVLALYLLRDKYSQTVKTSTWKYYEPRTQHGSSLSPCVYSLLACDIGDAEWAYQYFLKTAEIDLTAGAAKQFNGKMFKGGTHPAANGGAYMAAINGFMGVSVNEDHLSIAPRLPSKWQGVTFKVHYLNELLIVSVNKNNIIVSKCKESDLTLPIHISGKTYQLANTALEVSL